MEACLVVVAILVADLWPESDLAEHRIESLYAVSDPQFRRAMSSLLGLPLVGGNRVTELTNGVEAFPAMLAAIRSATRSITFETYIYWEGSSPARRSVRIAPAYFVPVRALWGDLLRAGVRIYEYQPTMYHPGRRCCNMLAVSSPRPWRPDHDSTSTIQEATP